jgi:hypothetical protein
MLNLNLNINGAKNRFGTGSHEADYRPKVNWDYRNVRSFDGTSSLASTGATMSIDCEFSNAYNIHTNSSNTFFTSEDTPITASMSGSGRWPVTGSTTMSLDIVGFGPIKFGQPYYFNETVIYDEVLDNSFVTASIFSASFTASKNFVYNVSASIIHKPGFEYLYEIRNDEFKDSIFLAMPGTLFLRASETASQFGMTNYWDDISSYVRSGNTFVPSGSNVELVYSASLILSSSNTFTSSTAIPTENYDGSTRLSGANAFYVTQSYAAKQGPNLTFTSSFTIETWAAFEETGSFITIPTISGGTIIGWNPNRQFVWKFRPLVAESSSYWWDGNWNDPVNMNITGSQRFVYKPVQASESVLEGTFSTAIIPYQFDHYAISYTSATRTLRSYKNQALQFEYQIPNEYELNQSITEPLQIMGSLDNGRGVYDSAGSGSGVLFNDFRLYNGTNKNYTGSIIPTPLSIVKLREV